MGVPSIHESQVPELDLPGRRLRWIVSDEGVPANLCSACVIRVAPGERVRPAHSHPNGEEVIYIVRGSGRVLVGSDIAEVHEGTTVLFPQGVPHMLHNTDTEEIKVVCFFAPSTGLENYRPHPELDFPDLAPGL